MDVVFREKSARSDDSKSRPYRSSVWKRIKSIRRALCSSEIRSQPCVCIVCLYSGLFSSGRSFLRLLTFIIYPLLTLDGFE